jgi:hypothetical protein
MISVVAVAISVAVEPATASATNGYVWSLLAWAYSDWITGTITTVILAIIFIAWIAPGCPGLWILFLLGGGGDDDSGSSNDGGDFGGGGASNDF